MINYPPFEKFSLLRQSDYLVITVTGTDPVLLESNCDAFQLYFMKKIYNSFGVPFITTKEDPQVWGENCCPGRSSDEFKQ